MNEGRGEWRRGVRDFMYWRGKEDKDGWRLVHVNDVKYVGLMYILNQKGGCGIFPPRVAFLHGIERSVRLEVLPPSLVRREAVPRFPLARFFTLQRKQPCCRTEYRKSMY